MTKNNKRRPKTLMKMTNAPNFRETGECEMALFYQTNTLKVKERTECCQTCKFLVS